MTKFLSNFVYDLRRLVSLEIFTNKDIGMSDLVLPECFCDDGILLNKDGSFTQCLWYSGADYHSEDDEALDYLNSFIYSNAFSRLGDNWTMHLDCDRKKVSGYIPDHQNYFFDATSAIIDAERKYDFEQDGLHYVNRFAITFTWLPPADRSTAAKNWFIEDSEGNIRVDYAEHLDKFKQTVFDVLSVLSSRVYTHPMTNDETLTWLNKCINGFEFKFPKYKHGWLPLYYRLGNQDVIKGIIPKVGEFKVGVVSVGEGIPQEAYPAFMHGLTTLDFEYRWSTRFIFLDTDTAKKMIDFTAEYHYQSRETIKQSLGNKNRGESTQRINRSAEMFADQAEDALEKLETEVITYGKYTCSVIVFDKDEKSLDEKMNAIKKVIMSLGFIAKREEAQCLDAYLGAIPGNVRNNVRKWVMDTINLADLMPTTDIWSGYEKNPCSLYGDNNPPLFYASIEGGTPFAGCTHVGDIGHAFIGGPSRAGKSVLVNFLAAQHFRYQGARGYHFDNGYSGLPLCYAMNGAHYDIAGQNESLAFKPLALLDTPEDFSFTAQWLSEIAEINLNRRVTAEERSDITQVLEIIKQQGTAEQKTINYFYFQLKAKSKNYELAKAFAEYTTLDGHGNTLKSRLFNATNDDLSLSRFSMFEVEKLMKTGDEVFIPTIRYLFYMIYRSFDGRPTFIILEEAWAILRHPIMQTMLDEWLRTSAKKNVYIIICSQQLNDILKSPICDVLLDQCKTKIFLPNPSILTNDKTPLLYEQFGLNHKQIGMIGNGLPQREYYFTNPIGNGLFDLKLNQVALTFLSKTSMDDIKLARQLKSKYKDLFGYYWLKAYGQDDAAEYWLDLNNTLNGR